MDVAEPMTRHPLKYFVNNADGLAADYANYRRLLQDVRAPDNTLTADQVGRAARPSSICAICCRTRLTT